MEDTPNFRVFIKPGCPWCIEAVDYLTKNNYSFETLDVNSDPDAFAEMQKVSGQTKAPTMLVDDLMLADFGVEELVPFLKQNDLFLG